jgi:xylulokinase
MEALLSVDMGTTGIKAAVYSADGRLLGASSVECPLINCGPGRVEQDPSLWWSLSVQSVREATALADEAAGNAIIHICAISVSSQGISFVPVDAGGEPLRHAICWLDTRATEEAAKIRGRIDDESLFRLTGKRPSAAYVLPKLLWLRRHEPDIYRRTHTFLMAHDYLINRLCGARLTDYSMAGGSILLDISQLAWSQQLLAEFGIDPAQLPGLQWAGTRAGELSRGAAGLLGLAPGTPVIVGGQDQKCAALGAGIRTGVATVSLGTASAITCLLDRPVLDVARRVPAFPFVRPGHWVLEGVVGTAGAALRWVRDTLFPGLSYADLDRLAADSPRGANGVCFYPHLAGATSPAWDAAARGSFTGLSLASGPADIARSVLEGVAYEIRANVEVVETLAAVDELIVFGGGARSQLWNTIIGEVTGKPVRATRTVDIANWGACLLAGIGTGLYPQEWSRWADDDLGPDIVPDSDRTDEYRALYDAYAGDGPRQAQAHAA